MSEIRGLEITDGRIDGNEMYLRFSNDRVLVIVGLPGMGVALIESERTLQ